MIRISDALTALRERLAGASASAALDAELIVAGVLGESRARLAADPGRPLAAEELVALEALVRRRLAGEPVAYLTGRREFWSMDIEVTPDVLVPRPETELLVERALAAVAGAAAPALLELGTGSGAVAISIARARPDAAVTATDVSGAALAVAGRNAARLGATTMRLLEGDWYAPLGNERFDAIASNPPYVAEGDPALAALAQEPRGALAAGPDGLAALTVIIAGAPAHLRPGGRLLLEHGSAQGAAVRALLADAGFTAVGTFRDLAGHERVSEGVRRR